MRSHASFNASSHKAIIVTYDGIEVNKKGSWVQLINMMQNHVISINQTRGSSYTALANGIMKHNIVKMFAGYLAYDYLENKILDPI